MSDKFEYSYSAKEQEEIRRIKENYQTEKNNKMERLRKLDESAKRPGTIIAIVIGVIGTLLLGVGMCCTLIWAERFFVPGIIVGWIGIALIAISYPLYKKITKRKREEIAEEVLGLIDELEEKH